MRLSAGIHLQHQLIQCHLEQDCFNKNPSLRPAKASNEVKSQVTKQVYVPKENQIAQSDDSLQVVSQNQVSRDSTKAQEHDDGRLGSDNQVSLEQSKQKEQQKGKLPLVIREPVVSEISEKHQQQLVQSVVPGVAGSSGAKDDDIQIMEHYLRQDKLNAISQVELKSREKSEALLQGSFTDPDSGDEGPVDTFNSFAILDKVSEETFDDDLRSLQDNRALLICSPLSSPRKKTKGGRHSRRSSAGNVREVETTLQQFKDFQGELSHRLAASGMVAPGPPQAIEGRVGVLVPRQSSLNHSLLVNHQLMPSSSQMNESPHTNVMDIDPGSQAMCLSMGMGHTKKTGKSILT